jgi:peptide methionine sulfoxide reductase MsrA
LQESRQREENTLKTWIMSEEERQQYIQKNPPKPMNKRVADYKWRGQKAAEASKKERDKKRQGMGAKKCQT